MECRACASLSLLDVGPAAGSGGNNPAPTHKNRARTIIAAQQAEKAKTLAPYVPGPPSAPS